MAPYPELVRDRIPELIRRPHRLLQVFPRFRDDPFERIPIHPHAVAPVRPSPDEIDALRRAVTGGWG